MITVCLYGGLRKYGRRFDLHAETPAEALHALFVQIQGLRQAVRDGLFQVRFNGQDQNEETIESHFRRPGSGILHIVPRVAGAGKAGQFVAGVALIAFAWWNPFGWAAGGALLSGVYSAGIGLALGGVAQMLTKQPKLDTERPGVQQSRNTSFSNLDNTAAQGRPVPLAYGLVYAGSRVVSQGVESRRLETSGDPVLTDPSARDVTLDIEKQFIAGTAAVAPNGQRYNTDFANDSVRSRNYISVLKKV